ncbi:MAG: hypothetical protein U0Q03_15870 [Acidimicrobiales bacterium]
MTDTPTADPVEHVERFDFAYEGWTGRAATAMGLGASRTWVEVDDSEVRVRFGPWRVATPLTNVIDAEVTGPYAPWKVAGTHWSLADHGLTFGTTAHRGVCLRFHEPITGGEPLRKLRHPGLTVTVAEPDRLVAVVRARRTAGAST